MIKKRSRNPSVKALLSRAISALESANDATIYEKERYWQHVNDALTKKVLNEQSRVEHERQRRASETQALRHDLGKVAGVLAEVLNARAKVEFKPEDVAPGQTVFVDRQIKMLLDTDVTQKIKNLPPNLGLAGLET